ncbi:hypothetical protein VOLCADRAFT_98903 [Volvox carteri f. nagariensis]|uniref:HECT-type E3 ubiquitin transferase n=1 Tax=Volvox carteri f. nagariensis TaxID=3068 RepID=D8UGK1_VOLCA|nr:uncharacterized protein VOLCADRAFT_98903 [Volvox carteri f. nagariensis]EFJ41137.1 hypothetical protein VOLCADRAFT_98903 [Volvox carteri f. nagariensis]|eukprot:XP_002957809.1 hypothetical protein VOLCADRAFT_98903 [Volvox carteri f. nagariensis]
MSIREAEAADRDKDAERINKMARIGRKHAALFELASQAGSESTGAPPQDWPGKLLRVMSSAGWADPSFLEELSESGLVRAMYRALPVLKANASNRATASSVQDLADLEESMRKLRHELALAEKRLPSHGILGTGGSAFYTTWASVGYVCTVMLQALVSTAACAQSPPATNTRTSPAPMDAATGNNVEPPPAPAAAAEMAPGEAGSATPQAAGPESHSVAESPTPATATVGAAGESPSDTSTPGGPAAVKPPPGGSGTGRPALVTEGTLLKLLGNKHVVAHARDVMRVVPDPCKAALARILLTQICTEMRAWLATGALLTAYSEALRPSLCPAAVGGAAATAAPTKKVNPAALVAPAAATASPGEDSPDMNLVNGGTRKSTEASVGDSAPSNAVPAGAAPATTSAGAIGDVEMMDAGAAATAEDGVDDIATAAAGSRSGGSDADSAAAASALETPPARRNGASCNTAGGTADGATEEAAAGSPSAAANGNDPAATADDDPRVFLVRLLQAVAAALCEAVTRAHCVARMAVLLRGEAVGKFSNAVAYMPTALLINELMAHLDGLACVATALGCADSIRPSITTLLTSQAIKELLGAGKVYVTTVIAAGALTRDLAIDAVIPQSLRQGYMAAVLTPLETGALLNERRAPQVLAYRSSITESSYYQVMDAEALPYGVNVRFEDEQEAEGMGVVREWLSQIAADIFSPERGLFVRGAADRRVVHPSPHSRMQEDHLGYMRFAGRIVGLALRANVPLGVVLSTGLFNYLTGRRATLQDLQQIDPQVFTTCQNILSSPGAAALELFHVWHVSTGDESGGDSQEQELVPGGAGLLVTDANKSEYVQLLAHHLVVNQVEEQDTAHHLPDDARLRRAFLSPLLLEDLNRITAGESTLDPEDWAQHTDEAGFEGPEEQKSLDMFWKLVSEYGPEDRQRLLQFWTAMTHLPSGGFKALNQRLQIMKLGPSGARQAAGEPGGGADRPPAAAPAGISADVAQTTNWRGPSTDGEGPHSHRLDGDSLEVEEQEHSDGMEEGGEDAEPRGVQHRQRQEGTTGLAVRAAAPPVGSLGVLSPVAGDAVPAAEANQSDAEGAMGTAAAAAQAVAVAGGAGSTHAPSASEPEHGDDDGGEAGEEPDISFGEEGDDLGGVEDAMDYGEEDDDDDEEFQRQLEMALALSLQDMSAAPAPESGSDGGSGGGNTGEGSPGGEREGTGEPSSGGAGASEAAAGVVSQDGLAQTGGEAGNHAEAAAAAREADNDVAGGGSRIKSAAEPGLNGVGAPEEAGADAWMSHGGGSDGGNSAPSSGSGSGSPAGIGSEGGVGMQAATGCTAAAEGGLGEGSNWSLESSPSPATAGATAAAYAEAVNEPGGPGLAHESGRVDEGAFAAASSDATAAGPAAAAAAAPGPPDGALPQRESMPMDTDGAVGLAASTSTQDAAAAAAVVAAAANGTSVEHGAATAAAAAGDPAGSGGDADLGPGLDFSVGPGGQQDLPHNQVHAAYQQEQREQEQREAHAPGGGQELQHELGGSAAPQPWAAEEGQGQVGTAGAEDQGVDAGIGNVAAALPPTSNVAEADGSGDGTTGGGGGGQEVAAAAGDDAPAPSASVALPLLPQARTCFLQLNLPVYASLEDMRRALAIALDNMSFGLH